MRKVLIVGANSVIADRIARRLVTSGADCFLVARDMDRVKLIAADLHVRGAGQVATERVDVTDSAALDGIAIRAAQALGGLDIVLFAAGLLPDQARVNSDTNLLRETMEINAISAMALLNETAAFFEQQGHGQIVAIGSVAGDRGRATNAAYGAAKGALEIFMSGLRQRLNKSGVKVLLVKPGFVDTPMTAAFKKGPLWATPERVARDIVRAMEKGKSVIYTPWWWRWIMLVIRHIPEPIFVRLRF